MSRFERQGLRRFSARDAVGAIALVAAAAACCSPAARSATRPRRWTPGSAATSSTRSAGRPNWVADQLPFEEAPARAHRRALARRGPRAAAASTTRPRRRRRAARPASRRSPPTPSTRRRSAKPPPKQQLDTLLVTGDSLSTPLDLELARRLRPTASTWSATRTSAPGSRTRARRLGQALDRPGGRGPPRRGGRLHRRQRGLPAARARAARRSVLRRRLGGRLRQPGAADDGHLPPGRRGEGLLADGADARATPRASGSSRWSTRRSRSPPSPGRARSGSSTRCRSSPRATSYRDAMEIDGERDDRPRVRRHPPERRGLGARRRRRPRPHRQDFTH